MSQVQHQVNPGTIHGEVTALSSTAAFQRHIRESLGSGGGGGGDRCGTLQRAVLFQLWCLGFNLQVKPHG